MVCAHVSVSLSAIDGGSQVPNSHRRDDMLKSIHGKVVPQYVILDSGYLKVLNISNLLFSSDLQARGTSNLVRYTGLVPNPVQTPISVANFDKENGKI